MKFLLFQQVVVTIHLDYSTAGTSPIVYVFQELRNLRLFQFSGKYVIGPLFALPHWAWMSHPRPVSDVSAAGL